MGKLWLLKVVFGGQVFEAKFYAASRIDAEAMVARCSDYWPHDAEVTLTEEGE